jgi:hypothetical protein
MLIALSMRREFDIRRLLQSVLGALRRWRFLPRPDWNRGSGNRYRAGFDDAAERGPVVNPFMLCGTSTPVQCTPNYSLIALVASGGLFAYGLIARSTPAMVIRGSEMTLDEICVLQDRGELSDEEIRQGVRHAQRLQAAVDREAVKPVKQVVENWSVCVFRWPKAKHD